MQEPRQFGTIKLRSFLTTSIYLDRYIFRGVAHENFLATFAMTVKSLENCVTSILGRLLTMQSDNTEDESEGQNEDDYRVNFEAWALIRVKF